MARPPARRRLRRVARQTLLSLASRIPHDPASGVIVAGHGRSGTTWIAEVLAGSLDGMLVFEPFLGAAVPGAARAGFGNEPCTVAQLQSNSQRRFVRQALAGRVASDWAIGRNPWSSVVRKRQVVVKAIRVNGLVDDIVRTCNTRPALVVVRDPASVVSSRIRAGWRAEPRRMLSPELTRLHPWLAERVDRCSDELEAHAAVWAIDHLLMLRPEAERRWRLIDYDTLRRDPYAGFSSILASWGEQPRNDRLEELAAKPSWSKKLSQRGPNAGGTPRSTGLEPKDRMRIRATARAFGVELYGDHGGFCPDQVRMNLIPPTDVRKPFEDLPVDAVGRSS